MSALPAARELIAFYVTDDRVVAAMNVNVWDVVDPLERLIRERLPADAAALRDPEVPIESLGTERKRPRRGGAVHRIDLAGD